ncbi:MAG TPA: DUF1707 domain-containing protein [Streptosporangiaceae bacterium]|nr:DUF1707 domain-containing protein [Streptosporangiaceae bacterium]
MDDRIRTSDADRERVTARLRDHFAEGRLTRDELDERIAAALNARTFGDLRRVLADLPEPRPVAPQRVPLMTAPRPYPVFRRGPRLFPLLAIALLALLLVHGAGPVAIFLEVVLSVVAVMFVFMMIAAITAATFFRRARKHWDSGQFDRYAGNWQAWTGPHGDRHQARCWRS